MFVRTQGCCDRIIFVFISGLIFVTLIKHRRVESVLCYFSVWYKLEGILYSAHNQKRGRGRRSSRISISWSSSRLRWSLDRETPTLRLESHLIHMFRGQFLFFCFLPLSFLFLRARKLQFIHPTIFPTASTSTMCLLFSVVVLSCFPHHPSC